MLFRKWNIREINYFYKNAKILNLYHKKTNTWTIGSKIYGNSVDIGGT